ncbi:MAG: DUF4401 domain-containing protein [Rhodospirillales bacterium]|nr:DUF4401 domain-containing protein [Rhodospirillales bacterium]
MSARDRVWATLGAHGLVEGPQPAASEHRSPWFVRVLMGIGGWLGAVFLLGFVVVAFEFVVDSAAASFVTGVVLAAGAVLLFRVRAEADFLFHFGLAISLAAQLLMAWGIMRALERHDAAAALGIALQQAAFFAAVAHPLHRVWAAGTCAYALCFALGRMGFAPYAPAFVTVGAAWIWLRELDPSGWHPARRAAGYGLSAVAVVVSWVETGSSLQPLFGHGRVAILGGAVSYWLGLTLGALVVVWVCLELLKRENTRLSSAAGRIAVAVAAAVAAAAMKAPGLAPAIILLVLGFANGNRILAVFGGVALVGYVSDYYYSLAATLLEKSALLAAAGLVLLLARFALQRIWPESGKEGSHA